MTISDAVSGWIFVFVGIFIALAGLIAKTHINDVDSPATAKERANAKATPMSRNLFVIVGVASCVYGLIRILR